MFMERIQRALELIKARTNNYQAESILVVTHNGVYKMIQNIINNSNPTDMYKIEDVKNCQLIQLQSSLLR